MLLATEVLSKQRPLIEQCVRRGGVGGVTASDRRMTCQSTERTPWQAFSRDALGFLRRMEVTKGPPPASERRMRGFQRVCYHSLFKGQRAGCVPEFNLQSGTRHHITFSLFCSCRLFLDPIPLLGNSSGGLGSSVGERDVDISGRAGSR